jgi:hypothetical protein
MPKAAINSTLPFSNYSTTQLVDELGRVKAEAAEIEMCEKTLKTELIARGVTEAEGALFCATVSQALRETIDTDKVKAEMGAPWWSARCKIGITTTVRVVARRGLKVAA